MALEVAAAVVGIIAAAGKVAEALGPVVSAFVHAPNHLRSIHIEVRNTAGILRGLQILFEDLEASSQHRRELIQLSELVATLSDGVLLFSKLEEFVSRLGDPRTTLASRMKWARKEKTLETLLKRLLAFKITIMTMINILQCNSDNEAHRGQQEIICLTRTLLRDNSEMARRIKNLEDRLVSRSSYLTRTGSFVSNLTRSSQLTGRRGSTSRDPVSTTSYQPVYQFDNDLQASRPYRKAKRRTADFSFCSSTGPSHAWTTMSEGSLSDISAISVIGLPLCPAEVTNNYHYGSWGASCEGRLSNIEEARCPLHSSVVLLPTPPPSPQSLGFGDIPIFIPASTHPSRSVYPTPPRSPSAINHQPSSRIKVVIKGNIGTEANRLTREFVHQFDHSEETADLINSYERTIFVDGYSVHLSIQVVNELPGADYTGFMDMHYSTGEAFILVYDTNSRESFDRIHRYGRIIYQYVDETRSPITIIGIKSDDVSSKEVSTNEAKAVAKLNGCHFREMYADDLVSVEAIFTELVRHRWAFENRVNKDKIMDMVRQDRQRYLQMQNVLIGRVSQLLNVKRKRKTIRTQSRAYLGLSFIEEDQ